MKLLIVCSSNSGQIATFVQEQGEALKDAGINVDYFGIEGKGWKGYLKSRKMLLHKIKEYQPDLLHAHFGLSGLLANLQRKIPVVTTYHGCDINTLNLRLLSVFPLLFSKFNIFVSLNQSEKVKYIAKKHAILPCGIDFKMFYPMDKQSAREELAWSTNKKYVLFSSSFSRFEKNAQLAIEAIQKLDNYELIELDGFNRDEVRLMMNACDVGLLTSLREGSPMFIKELMACKRPMISTNVGDVAEQIEGIDGCVIIDYNPESVIKALKQLEKFEQIDFPKEKYLLIDNKNIASQLIDIYKNIKTKN